MKILVLGDSVPAGFYDYDKGGWVNRLKTLLMDPENNIQVYNRSVSGDTTKDILKRIKTDCESIRPDIIIFEIGGNDSVYAPSKKKNWVSLADFRKNLIKLISIAHNFSDDILFLGLLPVNESIVNPWDDDVYYYNKYKQEYNKTIELLCKKEKIHFIPLHAKLTYNMLDDGLHPNSKGHNKIFEIVKYQLRKHKLI